MPRVGARVRVLQNGSAIPGLAAASTRRNSALMRSAPLRCPPRSQQTTGWCWIRARARTRPDTRRAVRRCGRRRSRREFALSPSLATRMVLAFGAGHVDSGVEPASGSASSTADDWRRATGSPAAGAGIETVVEAVPALLEEGVTAHLPASAAPTSFILPLISECRSSTAGHPAVAEDPRLEIARRLDVVDHGRAGHAREHVGGESISCRSG